MDDRVLHVHVHGAITVQIYCQVTDRYLYLCEWRYHPETKKGLAQIFQIFKKVGIK